MFPVSHQKSHNVFELYIITQYATVIFIRYDTEKLIILDPIKINGKVKELFQDGNNKIDQIVVGENLSNSQTSRKSNVMSVPMLILENRSSTIYTTILHFHSLTLPE